MSASTSFDHVVVGGGVVGAAAARSLAARGASVLLLERHARGHDLGSSHGASRIFRMGYDEPDYVALTLRALDAWHDLERASGRTLLDLTGAVDHGRPDLVDAIAATLDAAGVANERLTPEQASVRWPGLAFEGHVLAHASAGRIRSADALETFLDLAAADGADLRFGARVTGIDVADDGVTVTFEQTGDEQTGDGQRDDGQDGGERAGTPQTVRATSVVVAAGSWAPMLVGDLLAGAGASLPALRVTQEQPAHFPTDLPDDAWPSFVHYPLDGGDVYGLLTPGEGVKVGFHGTGPVLDDPSERDFAAEPTRAAALTEYVARWVPGVDATRPAFISCLYDNTPTDDFVIDRVGPVTVATGFSGHGFKFAPVLGDMIADLAGGGTAHPRFALR